MKFAKMGKREQWVSLNDSKEDSPKFLIRPVPFELVKTSIPLTVEGVPSFPVDGAKDVKTFVQAVQDWKNMYWEDGSEMECTDENKRYVANHSQVVRLFVLSKEAKLNDILVQESKN